MDKELVFFQILNLLIVFAIVATVVWFVILRPIFKSIKKEEEKHLNNEEK